MLIDSAIQPSPGEPAGFEHDAFVYTDDEEFVRGAAPFVHAGLAAGEVVMVAVPKPRMDRLREELGSWADAVSFVDMTRAARNPARLIPLWRDLLDEHPGRPVRALGEPVYVGRTPAEIEEAKLNEALINLAFEHAGTFRLRCQYEAAVLSPDLQLADNHPIVVSTGAAAAQAGLMPTKRWAEAAERTFRTALPPVPAGAEQRRFGLADLAGLREWVRAWARSYRLSEDRNDDLALALHEVCTNSIRFGGGGGTLTLWHEAGTLICDVADGGHITDLLIGRALAPLTQEGGRGVWLANQLCDLVQIRSTGELTQVRLYLRLE